MARLTHRTKEVKTPAKRKPSIETPTRQSKRIKSTSTPSKTSPKKSPYFEHDSESEVAGDDDESESTYEEETELSEPSEPDPTETESDESESDARPAKRTPKAKAGSQQRKKEEESPDERDLLKEGVKTGLGPGKQVFIKRPKPRGDGGIPYKQELIHPNTLIFLNELKDNNDRNWLKLHDPDFRTSEKDWYAYLEPLTDKIIEKDPTIPELPMKDVFFRIYRDVRFSKDKRPYKPYFSAAWSRTGRKGRYAIYYLQVQPNNRSFIAGGMWLPWPQYLHRLRKSIDRDPNRFLEVIMAPAFRKTFLNNVPADEAKVVTAFAKGSSEGALKTKPKGYASDHKYIELLRLRSFIVSKQIADEDILGEDSTDKVASLVGLLEPLVAYLNHVVEPDWESSSEEESGSEDEDEDGNND